MAFGATGPKTLGELPGLLSTLGEGELEELSAHLEEVSLPAGQTLDPDGGDSTEGSRSVAFVVEGELEVLIETDFPGKHIVLSVLRPGAVVGEVCAFGDSGQAITAAAASDSRLVVLPLKALDGLLETNPALGVKLLKGLLGVCAKRLEQSYRRLTSVF